MIIINGNVITGNNVVSLNGRILNDQNTANTKKIDERKSTTSLNVEKITIDSEFANINISSCNSSDIEAHLYGETISGVNVDFNMEVQNHELIISVNLTDNCYTGNLTLDISIPSKTFKSIVVETISTNITLSKNILTEYLKLSTQAGNIITYATFSTCSISAISGNIELCINATKDISVDISAICGNVSAKFNNISKINISTTSICGNTRNHHKRQTGYTANGNISTTSSNITIE